MKKAPLLAFLVLGASCQAAAPSPIFAWTFDEPEGVFTSNRGSAGSADLYLAGVDGKAAPFFNSSGQGVSGKPGDHAFDLTSASGMGAATPASNGPAGVVWSNSAGLQALSGLSSFTITGWIKPSVILSSAARIVATPLFTVMGGTEDRLVFQANGVTASEQGDSLYSEVGSWMFFAVVYDGTRSDNNVVYYIGSTAAGTLRQAGVATLAGGKLKPFSGQLLVGNNAAGANGIRPFKGLIDQIAIHGSATDASGALSKDQLEAVRADALR